ncbi:MAG: O-antigen ligase family protein [Magnetococcus sp. THC-1_WYH]
MVDTFLVRLFGVLLVLFFLVVMHVPVPGMGGGPVVLVAVHLHWVVLAAMILVGLLRVLNRGTLIVSSFTKYFVLFVLLVLLAAVFQPPINEHAFIFQTAGLVGGLLLLVSFHQFPMDERQRRWILWVLLLATVIQAGIALDQGIWGSQMVGTFGQKNLLATFVATGFLIALLLAMERQLGYGIIILLSLVSALSMTALVMAGSRSGLLGAVLGLLIVIPSRWGELRYVGKRVLVIFLFAILVTTLIVQRTQQQGSIVAVGQRTATFPATVKAIVKNDHVEQKTGRILFFETAWGLFLQQPLWGQGMGGFLAKNREFVQARYPTLSGVDGPDATPHPHNEFLLRLAESGVGAGVGMLLMLVDFLATIHKLGRRDGGTYLALVMPVGIYLQVGGAFYESAALWATLLLLVSLPTSQTMVRTVTFRLYAGIRSGMATVAVGIFVGIALFLVNTAWAQVRMTNYMALLESTHVSHGELLQPALDNLYLRQIATRLFMDVRLRIAILRQDRTALHEFLAWSRQERKVWPDYVMVTNEVRAHHALGDVQAASALLVEGERVIPEWKSLGEGLRKELNLQ